MIDEQLFFNLKEQVQIIDENYISIEDIDGKYVPLNELENYLTKTEIEENYLTIVDGDEKINALKDILNTKMDVQDLSVYATKEDLQDTCEELSNNIIGSIEDKILNLDIYTKSEIDDKVKDIVASDMSDYLKKDEITEYGYVTEEKVDEIVESKKYLTEHQSLEEYVKINVVNNIIDTKLDDEFGAIKDFYDKKIENLKEIYSTNNVEVTSITKNEIEKTITDSLVDYITHEELDNILKDKEYVDNQSLYDYVAKYVSTKLSKLNYLTQDDLSDYVKKSDIPLKLSDLFNDSSFLTEHQSLAGYAKKSELKDYVRDDEFHKFVESIDLTLKENNFISKDDVNGYAISSEIPTKVSQLENDKNYLTKHQSLDGYVKRGELDVYVTTSDLNDRIMSVIETEVTQLDLTNYAKLSDLPSKLSDLINDAGYLKEHQSLKEYVKRYELSDYTTDVEFHEFVDLMTSTIDGLNFATKDEIKNFALLSDVPKKISDLFNDSKFLTEHQSLAGYARKTDLNEYVRDDEFHRFIESLNLSAGETNFITKDEAKEYALSSEIPTKVSELINDRNYLTEHQSLTGYVKRNELDVYVTTEDIDDIKKTLQLDTSKFLGVDALDNYVQKSELPTRVSQLENDKNYLTKHQSLAGYVKKDDLDGYVTETALNERINSLAINDEVDLSNYVQKSEMPTKVSQLENDKNYLTKHQSLAGYVKKDDLNEYLKQSDVDDIKKTLQVDTSDFLGVDALDNYVQKSELPTRVSQLENDKNYLTQHQSLTGYVKRNELEKYITQEYFDEQILSFVTLDDFNDLVINSVNLSEYVKKADIPTKLSQLVDDKKYLTEHQSLTGYARKTDLNEYVRDDEFHRFVESVNFTMNEFVANSGAIDVSKLNIPTKISQLVNDKNYLTEHQSLAGYVKKGELDVYVTSNELDEKIKSLNLTDENSNQVDLSEYAKKSDIPLKISDLFNDSNFLTKHQSLAGYVKKDDLDKYATLEDVENVKNSFETVDTSGFLTADSLKDYVTKVYVDSKLLDTKTLLSNYTQKNELTQYVKKSTLPNFDDFVKLSDLPKGETYLSQSGVDEIIKSYGFALQTDIPDTSNFVKTDKLATYTKSSDFEKYKNVIDARNYQTKSDIETYLESYVKKSELGTATRLDVENIQDMISNTIDGIHVPTNVSELYNDKGYLTQHQSLLGYVKFGDLNKYPTYNDVENEFVKKEDFVLPTDLVHTSDIEKFATKSEIGERLVGVVYKPQLADYMSENLDKYTRRLEGTLDLKYISTNEFERRLEELVGDTDTNGGVVTQTDLENYVRKDKLEDFSLFERYADIKYTTKELMRAYVDIFNEKISNQKSWVVENFTTKSTFENGFDSINSSELNVNLDDYYTKAQSHLQFLSKEDYRGIKEAATINFEYNDYPDLFFQVLNNDENIKINDGFYVIEEKAYIIRNNQIVPICDRRTPHWEIETTDEDWMTEGLDVFYKNNENIEQ